MLQLRLLEQVNKEEDLLSLLMRCASLLNAVVKLPNKLLELLKACRKILEQA
ncbi:hypothetical protein D3C73_1426010 [compost metagenome]